jgi:hypothetical protein
MVEHKVIFIDKDKQELMQAIEGFPFFVVVQDTIDTKGTARARMSKEFDTDHLFAAIKSLARKDKAFKEKLADYIIDLSKEI